MFSLIWKKTPFSAPSVVFAAENKTTANRYSTCRNICGESLDKLTISKCMEHINYLPIDKIVWQDRKGEKFLTHPLILIENTARQTQTFVNKFAPLVPNVKLFIPWSSSESLFFYLSITIQLWPIVFLAIRFQLPHNSVFTFKWKHKSCRFIMQLSRLQGKQNMEIPERLRSALLWNSSAKKKKF